MVWLGSMTLEQVEHLETVFAKLTEDGWKIPEWLVMLRHNVEERVMLDCLRKLNPTFDPRGPSFTERRHPVGGTRQIVGDVDIT
jgi:hypothetical protein